MLITKIPTARLRRSLPVSVAFLETLIPLAFHLKYPLVERIDIVSGAVIGDPTARIHYYTQLMFSVGVSGFDNTFGN
jgi:hypothetical protein